MLVRAGQATAAAAARTFADIESGTALREQLLAGPAATVRLVHFAGGSSRERLGRRRPADASRAAGPRRTCHTAA